jgi:predicted RND superfamily exporter protein
MFGRIVASVLGHPRRAALAWMVLVIIAIAGVLQLRVDFSSTAFFGDDAQSVATLAEFHARWGPDDRTLVVVLGSPDGDIASADAFAEMDRLARALEDDAAVARVISLPSLRINDDGPSVGELVRTVPNAIEHLRTVPGVVPLLLSEDGRHAALLVELATSTDDLGDAVAAIDSVEHVIAAHAGRLTTGLAGIPAVRAAFFGLTLRDQMLLGPLALAIAAIGLVVALRRVMVLAAAALGAGVPLLLLMGTMGWTGEPVGLLNQAYFTLLPVIAVADTVVFIARADEIRRDRPEASEHEVVIEAAKKVGHACLLTSLTTAIGFGSLALSSAPILRNFGLWAALGILYAYAVVLLLVPLVLPRLGRPPEGGALLRRIGRFATGRPLVVIAATALIAGVAVVPAMRVEVDNHLSRLLRPEHPVTRAGAIVDEHLGGILSLELEVHDPSAQRLEEIRTWATAQPEVRAVLGPFGSDPQSASFRAGDFARVSIRVPDIGGKAFAQLEQRAKAEIGGDDVTFTGTPSLAYHGVNRITHELRASLLFVLVVVTVLIGLLLRRPLLALLAVPPNLLPLWFGYAAIGLTGIELDPICAVILSVALGVAVDNTIHIMVRCEELRREGLTPREAAAKAVQHTGRAATVTSLAIAAGLAVNVFSSFPPLAVLGTLGAGVIVFALFADLLLTPALIALTR